MQGADDATDGDDGENQWPGSGLLRRRGKTAADKVSPAIVQLSRAEITRAKSQKWCKNGAEMGQQMGIVGEHKVLREQETSFLSQILYKIASRL